MHGEKETQVRIHAVNVDKWSHWCNGEATEQTNVHTQANMLDIS